MNKRLHFASLAALIALLPTLLPLPAVAQERAPQPDGERRFEVRPPVPHPDGAWKARVAGAPRVALFGGPRGYLGVHLVEITPQLRQHYGAAAETGVLIGQVEEDSPAATAGLQVGDVVTHLDGEAVANARDIGHRVSTKEDGETVTVTVLRDGKALDFAANITRKEGEGLPRLAAPRFHFVPRGDFEFRGEDGEVIKLEDLPNMQWFDAERMGEVFRGPQWESALEQLQATRQPLLQRIDELEKRLAEMEALLKKLDK